MTFWRDSLGVLGHLAAGLEGGAGGRATDYSPAGEEVAVGGVHFREVVEIGQDDGQPDEAPADEYMQKEGGRKKINACPDRFSGRTKGGVKGGRKGMHTALT